MARLLLIDGHSLLYRAFHALPHLTTPEGEPIQAVYGLASMILTALKNASPDALIFAFDKKGKTFRHKAFKEYKAFRPEMAEELVLQQKAAREMVDALGVPVLEEGGVEADDVIATLCRRAVGMGFEVMILSGDRDLLQLVDEKVKVFSPARGFLKPILFDVATVFEKYGVRPERWVDFKALVGDPSDNLPGVRGIGEKTAIQLLERFGSFISIYNHLNELPEKTAQILRNGKEKGELSLALARLKTDLPLEVDWRKAHLSGFLLARLLPLFTQWGFRSLLKRLKEQKEIGRQPRML